MSSRAWVWGANNAGQLGLGYQSEQVSLPTQLIVSSSKGWDPDSGSVQRRVVAIQGGGSHTLVLVKCTRDGCTELTESWYEALHFGMVATKHAFPTEATRFPDTQPSNFYHDPQIACGWDFSLYLSAGGQLFSCGDNKYGQLARKCDGVSVTSNMTFAPVLTIATVCEVSAGLRHAVAVCKCRDEQNNMCLMVWGDNSKKQLGLTNTHTAVISEPTKVTLHIPENGLLTEALKVSCGKYFTIVWASDGCFYGCGLDKFGIFGRDSGGNGGKPVYLSEFTKLGLAYPEGGHTCQCIDSFKCGWNHVLVLLDTGRVVSWGRNNFSQLGRPTTGDYDWIPAYVQIGLNKDDPAVQIACGSEHSLALTQSGKVYAWGWNEHENCGIVIKNPETDHIIPNPTLVPIICECDPEEPPDEQQQPQEKVVLIGCGAGNSFVVTSSST